MGYKHLSLVERHYILIERKLEKSCPEITFGPGRTLSNHLS